MKVRFTFTKAKISELEKKTQNLCSMYNVYFEGLLTHSFLFSAEVRKVLCPFKFTQCTTKSCRWICS